MRNRLFLFLILLSSINSSNKVFACTYAPWGNNIFDFLRGVLQVNPSYFDTHHLVAGPLTSVNYNYGISVKVGQVILGQNNLKDTIKIWGDPGTTCRMNVAVPTSYIGDTVIALIEPLQFGVQTQYESDSDYSIHGATWGYAFVRNDSVFGAGNYIGSLHLPLADFIDSIQQIIQTAASVPGINTQKAGLSVFPNPAPDMAYIHSPINGNLSITVFNSAGVCVWRKEDVAHATRDNVQLSTTGWSPGLYFVRCISSDGQIQTCRFIKE